MLDIAAELRRWIQEGRDVAVATVIAVSGSAPRPIGAALAVDGAGTVIGSVSGGCVEGAVVDLCAQALHDGKTHVERFGYSDDDAFAVGLSCGGIIDILITPVRKDSPDRPVYAAACSAAAARSTSALVRVTDGPEELLGRAVLVRRGEPNRGTLGDPDLDRTAAREAEAMLHAGRTGRVEIGESGSRCGRPVTLLVESSVPAPRMIIFGAIDFAAALARVGTFLGYRVTVCDARAVFTTPERFPAADEVIVDWPHRYLAATETDSRSVLCVLTHDAKFDIPLLTHALTLPVAFVGAMGSRRTHQNRQRLLRDAGVTDGQLARLHSPIGLDLGARTPEETALSIAAEIVAARYGGSGVSLTGEVSPIHHDHGPRAA